MARAMFHYYEDDLGNLEPYQRLIQYCGFFLGTLDQTLVLDSMNFHPDVYPELVSPTEMASLARVESSYMTPDASYEFGQLIRRFEGARWAAGRPGNDGRFQGLASRAGVGVGSGCTGTVIAMLRAILAWRARKRRGRSGERPEIVTHLPNYTVYSGQLEHLEGLCDTRYVEASRASDFLPTADDLIAAATERTAAILISYPTNPAQTTYEGERADDLRRLAAFCQEREIFLVCDTIYQDLIYSDGGRPFEEPFFHSQGLDFIVKVFGPSKDTPFLNGHRLGYWIGDPRLCDAYRYAASSFFNSPNIHSLSLFAMHIYLRTLRLEKRRPREEDMSLFDDGVFGTVRLQSEASRDRRSRRRDNAKRLLDELEKQDLCARFAERAAAATRLQREANDAVLNYVEQSQAFSEVVNGRIGNVALIRVDPDRFSGDDHDLFLHALRKAHCGVLPGNVFGLPRKKGEAWFRITLIHDRSQNIANHLAALDESLAQGR